MSADGSGSTPYCFDYAAMPMVKEFGDLNPGTRVSVFYELTVYRGINFLFSLILEPGKPPSMSVGPLPPIDLLDAMPPVRLLIWKALDLLREEAEAGRQRQKAGNPETGIPGSVPEEKNDGRKDPEGSPEGSGE